MATIRILATVCAALFAGLTLSLASGTLAPAAAAPESTAAAPVGRPLNLLPQLKKAKKFTRQASKTTRVLRAKTLRRTARNRAAPAARVFARRQADRAVAQREDDGPVTPSLGYQAESKGVATASNWLRKPIEAANRAPASAGARVQIPAAEFAPASADPDDVSTSAADTVQVADAAEFNEIDLAASETPFSQTFVSKALVSQTPNAASETPAPTDNSWIHGLLAVLGGAFAAAASARFLLA